MTDSPAPQTPTALPPEVEKALDFFDEGRAGCTCPERCPWKQTHASVDSVRTYIATLARERDKARKASRRWVLRDEVKAQVSIAARIEALEWAMRQGSMSDYTSLRIKAEIEHLRAEQEKPTNA